ncbi:MAG: L-lactate permease [Desulfomonilaceae bacterium]
MDLSLFVLSWSPVIFLTVLAVVLRRSALELSVYGFIFSLGLTLFFFKTPLDVAVMASLDGVLTSLPLLLVILTGILFSSLLMATGSITRIVEWFEHGAGDPFSRNILITFGVGNFMEGSGVIAEPVVAPMLFEARVAPEGSAALSIIGYSGMMTLELAGIIITVLSLVTNLPMDDLGVASAWLSIPATLTMALCAFIFLPQEAARVRRLIAVILSGLLLSIVGLLTAAFVGIHISGTVAGLALIAALVFMGSGRLPINRGILYDLAPFILMLVCLFSVNIVPYLRTLTFEKLVFKVSVIPIHAISFSPLFSAYVYLLVAFLFSAWIQEVPPDELKTIVRLSLKKGWRVFLSMGLFGAMGQMISYTGYNSGFSGLDSAHNIPAIISKGLTHYSGNFYPIFVPILGWVGTFLTGYGVASLMLFGQLQVQAATLLGVSSSWLAAGLAVGSSVGSISSPFKVALATPMCGAIGKEGDILRWTIPLGLLSSLIVGIALWLGI